MSCRYGVGNVFFSKTPGMFEKCKAVIEKHCADKGFELLHWRDVPTDNSVRTCCESTHTHAHARTCPRVQARLQIHMCVRAPVFFKTWLCFTYDHQHKNICICTCAPFSSAVWWKQDTAYSAHACACRSARGPLFPLCPSLSSLSPQLLTPTRTR